MRRTGVIFSYPISAQFSPVRFTEPNYALALWMCQCVIFEFSSQQSALLFLRNPCVAIVTFPLLPYQLPYYGILKRGSHETTSTSRLVERNFSIATAFAMPGAIC
jgi:hypothetical protein